MRAPFQLALFNFASFANHIEDAFADSETSGHPPASRLLVQALIEGGRTLRRGLVALAIGEEEQRALAMVDGYEIRWGRMLDAVEGRHSHS